MKYTRQFISFSGECPFRCNHCYTFSGGYCSDDKGTCVTEIIDYLKLKNKDFDIVYVSGHKENFINPDAGLSLCEEIFGNFGCDILITTRCVFNSNQLERLALLNKKMKENGKDLFFCQSIPALESYKKLEPNPIIPSPWERIKNFQAISEKGIYTILTLRPLCPNEYIPVEESLRIIEMCKDHSTVVLSSGIVINDTIEKKLKGFPKDYKCVIGQLMPCLKNDLSMRYVDVSKELAVIRDKCDTYGIPLFSHSLPAIEHIKGCTLEYDQDS